MPQTALDCPHCGTKKSGFRLVSACQILQTPQSMATLQCGVCGKGIIVEVNSSMVGYWQQGAPLTELHIFERYPESPPSAAPAHTPEPIAAAYLSGLRNLDRSDAGDANAAVAMFRRALELSVRELNSAAPKGANLIGRIERLSTDLVTPAMKKWAHEIRLGGNEALHEPEDFTREEAERLQTFTELFLTYAFSLPAMLRESFEPK